MEQSFLDYAMSVIVSRALPDVRDGLKPVHRRILWAMHEGGLRPDRNHRKCATVVGDVLGKYHPHGDQSVYDALVRMGQNFSLRHPLVDPHGNFGSPSDPPAAYRYTECRLTALAMHMLAGIDEETVDFVPNFDGTTEEPTVLPGSLPQPAGQRQPGHRGRHGDEHPAPQPGRGHRRHDAPHRPSRRDARRPHGVREGTGLSDRSADHGPRRARVGVPHGPGFDQDAGEGRDRGRSQGRRAHRRHRDPVPDVGRTDRGEDRRARQRPRASRGCARSATSAPRAAPGWSSSSSATRRPTSCSTTSTSTHRCRPPSRSTSSRWSTACRAHSTCATPSPTTWPTRSTSSPVAHSSASPRRSDGPTSSRASSGPWT